VLGKQEIEVADNFTHLGSMMTGTGGIEDEVKAWIQKANAAFIQCGELDRYLSRQSYKFLRTMLNLSSFFHVKLGNPQKRF
jgi:hypothetical protein